MLQIMKGMARNSEMNELTIETLEKMFVYLGCANIDTSQMDGAVPIESMLSGDKSRTIAEFNIDKLHEGFELRTIYFSGDTLSLNTAKSVHWSRALDAKSLRRQARWSDDMAFSRGHDGKVLFFHSEIDKNGRFVKFPVNRYRTLENVIVHSKFNPLWAFEFAGEMMHCRLSDNNDLYRSLDLKFLVPFVCGVAQSLDHYWLVRTRFEECCPSLTLLTDATGVKEFWKLRDIPEGKKRRSALLHWVESHFRKTRVDPDVESYVRKHMRGSEDLTMGKFCAKITPSKKDLLDEAIAVEERERMKKLKTDRRVRGNVLCSGVATKKEKLKTLNVKPDLEFAKSLTGVF